MLAPYAKAPFATAPLRTALALALWATLAPGPASAAPGPDCKHLYDLYQNCFESGLNSDSAQSCLSISFRDMERTAVRLNAGGKKKKPGATQAMVELVCSTGCDDATTTLVRASQQEFNEAFCE